jgi:hypothetical protein
MADLGEQMLIVYQTNPTLILGKPVEEQKRIIRDIGAQEGGTAALMAMYSTGDGPMLFSVDALSFNERLSIRKSLKDQQRKYVQPWLKPNALELQDEFSQIAMRYPFFVPDVIPAAQRRSVYQAVLRMRLAESGDSLYASRACIDEHTGYIVTPGGFHHVAVRALRKLIHEALWASPLMQLFSNEKQKGKYKPVLVMDALSLRQGPRMPSLPGVIRGYNVPPMVWRGFLNLNPELTQYLHRGGSNSGKFAVPPGAIGLARLGGSGSDIDTPEHVPALRLFFTVIFFDKQDVPKLQTAYNAAIDTMCEKNEIPKPAQDANNYKTNGAFLHVPGNEAKAFLPSATRPKLRQPRYEYTQEDLALLHL